MCLVPVPPSAGLERSPDPSVGSHLYGDQLSCSLATTLVSFVRNSLFCPVAIKTAPVTCTHTHTHTHTHTNTRHSRMNVNTLQLKKHTHLLDHAPLSPVKKRRTPLHLCREVRRPLRCWLSWLFCRSNSSSLRVKNGVRISSWG